MTAELSILFAMLLVAVTFSALLIKRLVYSLIMLFYSGLLLGGIFLLYGAAYAGLFQIITFAGAVSVMFMVILMLVGGELAPASPRFLRERSVGYALAALGFVVVASLLWQFSPPSTRIREYQMIQGLGVASDDPLSFLWALRSWDLLFLVILISAALAGIINLFSREAAEE